MPSNVNTLCESQAQCPDIPAEYFDQDAPITASSDEAELLITLTSFFGGYALLLTAFVVFSLCRNQVSDSRKTQRVRIILILCTVLIETFDVLTDAAQINNIFAGVDCGATQCVKRDTTVAAIMIPLIILGAIGTLISLYTFCKTTTTRDIESVQQKKINKLDRYSIYLKVWCENVPMLFLVAYWMYAGGGSGLLTKYSFISTTTIVSLCVSAFNFYWMLLPVLCKCCCRCGAADDSQSPHRYEAQQQIGNALELATQPQPITMTAFVPNTNNTVAVAQPYIQQQSAPAGDLPTGWMQCVDANGRVYYQNSMTQQTQWERPMAAAAPQYAPSVPSDMAPRPMQNDGAVVAEFDDNPEAYYQRDDELPCCAKACLWWGCGLFSVCFGILMVWSTLFVLLGSVSLSQSTLFVLSVDDTCLVVSNFDREVGELHSNVTGESYTFHFWQSAEDWYPLLEDGVDTGFASFGGNDPSQGVGCEYTTLPEVGQCVKFMFKCGDPTYVEYTTDALCRDFCPS